MMIAKKHMRRIAGLLILIIALGCSYETKTVNQQPDTDKNTTAVNTVNRADIIYAGLNDEEKTNSINTVKRGLEWLASCQNQDGGWGAEPEMASDIGNTSSVALAFVRAGHTPSKGRYKDIVRRAIDFVVSKVEIAPDEGLTLRQIQESHNQQTKLQMKLGPHVDTFLANLLLAEVKDKIHDKITVQKVTKALEKCVAKIEDGQEVNGAWNSGGGWAPIISTSIAQMSLEKARDQGVKVEGKVLKGVQDYMRKSFNSESGRFESAEKMGAGVQLYANNAALRTFSDMPTAMSLSPKEKADQDKAMETAIAQLDKDEVIRGFGSNGGEEFLSYMSASETLVRKNSKSWPKWNKRITNNLCLVQNKDGSWSGQHCITERVFCTASAILTLTCGGWADIIETKAVKHIPEKITGQKYIDLVFAVDVSGSMERVIAAAQKKIWAIVNKMVSAKPTPVLRIGLIAYRGEKEACYNGTGFNVWDFSDDLDKIYEQLMGLKTSGGAKECVGRAIYEATNSMSWSKDSNAFRVLFVLGNEPANQDTNQDMYGYKKVSGEAIQKDININTVYCAQNNEAAGPGWKEISLLADGSFASISLQGKVVDIPTPMDKKLVELNDKLNKTYIAYGSRGKGKLELQKTMDRASNSVGGSSTMAERTLSKSSKGYSNPSWDLVDAAKDDDFEIENLESGQLPEEMKDMTNEEQEKYIEKKSKERQEIQKQITELGKKRTNYINEEMKKQKLEGDEFDVIILKTLQKQAEEKGFNFENK